MNKKYIAEIIGTFILVFVGCFTALLTGGDVIATALAFGSAMIIVMYVIGNISGGYINPAVTLAMFINKRISGIECGIYMICQFVGALLAAGIMKLLLMGPAEGETITTLGQNVYGIFDKFGALAFEVILTFIFVLVFVKVTSKKNNTNLINGIVIGLALMAVHLVGVSLTGTSVNPARSFAPALIVGGDALKEVWVFIVGPFIGAALAAVCSKFILDSEE